MTYEEWELGVPQLIKDDAVWSIKAYRLAMFLGDLAWQDCTKLMQDRRTLSTADQLHRAVRSIAPDLSEGYSRSGGKDRARFYEYALGSTRESRDWYYGARQVLGDSVFGHRLALATEIIRLIISMVAQQRRSDTRLG